MTNIQPKANVPICCNRFDDDWFVKIDSLPDKNSIGKNFYVVFTGSHAMVTELQVHYLPVFKERPKNPEPTEAVSYSILSIEGKLFTNTILR